MRAFIWDINQNFLTRVWEENAILVLRSLNKVPQSLNFLKNAANKRWSEHMVSIKKWSRNDNFGQKSVFRILEIYILPPKNLETLFWTKLSFWDHFLMETICSDQRLLMTFFKKLKIWGTLFSDPNEKSKFSQRSTNRFFSFHAFWITFLWNNYSSKGFCIFLPFRLVGFLGEQWTRQHLD